jgi:hypothetical protein
LCEFVFELKWLPVPVPILVIPSPEFPGNRVGFGIETARAGDMNSAAGVVQLDRNAVIVEAEVPLCSIPPPLPEVAVLPLTVPPLIVKAPFELKIPPPVAPELKFSVGLVIAPSVPVLKCRRRCRWLCCW